MNLYWPNSEGEQFDMVGYNRAIMLLYRALNAHITNSPRYADFRVYSNIPYHPKPAWLKKDGLPILAYTMYESTVVPSGWVDFLNNHCEVVLVPSDWCRHVFYASGVIRPIYVVSLGVDPADSKAALKEPKPCAPYVFLWQGVAYDPKGRKGVDVAVQAFKELKQEGKLRPEDELIIKFRPYERIDMVFDDVRSPLGIRYNQRLLSRQEMRALLGSVDCCINPTHGEGFGLIPLEQMAAGKPVLVTGYSIPYIKEGCCLPLEYETHASPVMHNHKHLKISANGVAYNLGGEQVRIEWLPKKIARQPVGNYQVVTPAGIESKKNPIHKEIGSHIINGAASIQEALHLYSKRGRKPITFYQEWQGLDAYVNVEDLKKKMMWCYENRWEAFDIGFCARNYALKEWNLDRIESEFCDFARAYRKDQS